LNVFLLERIAFRVSYINELDGNILYDRTLWRRLIHVADIT